MKGKPTAGFIAQEDLEIGHDETLIVVPSEDERVAEAINGCPAKHRMAKDYNGEIAYLSRALQVALARIEALEARLG